MQIRVNRVSPTSRPRDRRIDDQMREADRSREEEKGGRYPVPAVIGAPERRTRGLRAGRAHVPFLAQLALQYDSIGDLRRARRERLAQAVKAYGGAKAGKARPQVSARTAGWA
ncbi:MAG: hypothetical protein D6773_06315 [Alphaproteobacteria bacterium]|nr:MAG: hypothetical protein D6773_06315 [Alphaproteobacteria bacterium]